MQSGRDDYYFQKQTMLFIFLRISTKQYQSKNNRMQVPY